MATGLQNDYFSLGTLGYDPYAQQKADTLSRYQQMDSMLQQQTQTAPGTTPKPAPAPTNPMPLPYAGVTSSGGQGFAQVQPQQYVNPYLTASAQTAMQTGGAMGTPYGRDSFESPLNTFNATDPNRVRRTQAIVGGDDGSDNGGTGGSGGGSSGGDATPRTNPDRPCPAGYAWDDYFAQCMTIPPSNTPTTGGTATPRTGTTVVNGRTLSPNLDNLTQQLVTFFTGKLGENYPSYPGNMTATLNPRYLNTAEQTGQYGTSLAEDWSNTAGGIVNSLQGFNPIGDVSPLKNMISSQMNHGYDPQTMGLGWIGSTVPSWYEMLANGGAPNITGALNDIQTRGMMGIEDQNAQIREQFGKMGLSAGSDVAEAVARGSSRGIADINSQQSQLISQVLGQAQDRRVQTMGMAPGMATGASQPYENAQNRQLQQNLQNLSSLPGLQGLFTSAADQQRANAGVQLGALSAIPGLGQMASSPFMDLSKLYGQYAGIDAGLQQSNIAQGYQNWVQSNTPKYLNPAVALATGAQQPPVEGGGNSWMSVIGGLIGLMGAFAGGS